MRTFAIVIFAVSIISPVNAKAKQTNDELTAIEKQAIEQQKKILDEIAALYAERALERPKNFTACVREMFAMRRSDQCRDKFTHYFTPEEVSRLNESADGQFGGVGIELAQENVGVVVLSVTEEAPASRAGIRPRDIITKVNGKNVSDANEAVLLIRGKVGTEVNITIFRKENNKQLIFKLKRQNIISQTVKWRLSSTDNKIGIIDIRHFDNNVPAQFAEAVIGVMKKGAKSVVIDLRDNPGGLVNSVLSLLSLFANDTDILLTFHYRYSKETVSMERMPLLVRLNYLKSILRIQQAVKLRSLNKLPVVILINNGSASASEIFSGTMKDWGYPIVGVKSYGKGVGQEMFGLSDGSRLALTTFEFLVGNRRVVIRDKGVTPTVEVKMPGKIGGATKRDEKDDVQLLKALEVLQSCGKNDPARKYKCVRE